MFSRSLIILLSARRKAVVVLTALGALFCLTATPATRANPLFDGADPDILVDNKTYWIFPTTESDGKNAFFAYGSADLRNWTRSGPILKLADVPWIAADGAPSHELWAPGILKHANKYFLYYAVGPQNPTPSRIGVAISDKPDGKYVDTGKPLVTGGADFEAIDPMVFQDPQSHKIYLYCGGSAGHNLHVYELNDDCITIKQQIPVDTPTNFTEAPFMCLHEHTYFLAYSHGRWNDDTYCVCYSSAPSPIGPWTYQGAILASNNRHAGPGHHAFFQAPLSGQWYIVYHRWNDGKTSGKLPAARSVCIDPIVFEKDTILPITMTDAGGPFLPAVKAEPVQISKYVKKVSFGKGIDGEAIDAFILTNKHGLEATVITYGATLTKLMVPDASGKMADIVLGFDELPPYESKSPYFGATIGRYANRIANASFTLDGKTYNLAGNDGKNTLHGGERGFSKRCWEAKPTDNPGEAAVTFSYVSPDGEEGFPGLVKASVSYKLTDDNKMILQYTASTTQATPINLTNHSYFNLAGAGSGDILRQRLRLNADSYTPVDKQLIPTGAVTSVKDTAMDFTEPKAIGKDIARVEGGYDHNFVLRRRKDAALGSTLVEAADLKDSDSGREMKMFTTEPALQFYSGNFLDGTIKGVGGNYGKHAALCLEAQHFPDSVHHSKFPDTILRPGQEYRQTTIYSFSTVPAGTAFVAFEPTQAADEHATSEQRSLFTLIDALEHSLPLKKEAVEKITGCKLHVDDSVYSVGGNKGAVEYVSGKSPLELIGNVELTQFAEATRRASGILTLFVNKDASSVTEASIRARYGKPSLVMEQPVADVSPDGQPNSLNYERTWGTLIFAVSKSGNHFLQHVVLRAVVEPPLPVPRASSRKKP